MASQADKDIVAANSDHIEHHQEKAVDIDQFVANLHTFRIKS